jgi:hypothetical protein
LDLPNTSVPVRVRLQQPDSRLIKLSGGTVDSIEMLGGDETNQVLK